MMAEEFYAEPGTPTGVFDKTGNELFVGDKVKMLDGSERLGDINFHWGAFGIKYPDETFVPLWYLMLNYSGAANNRCNIVQKIAATGGLPNG